MIPKSFSEYFESLSQDGRMLIIAELSKLIVPQEIKDSGPFNFLTQDKKLDCPKCKSNNISGNGKHNGVQRYVCKDCKKYFRDSTGGVLYNLKKSELLSSYLYNMLMGYSIKKCGEETGICIQTSFDWRHKILSSFNAQRPLAFEGIVESDDIFFLESDKGSREIERPIRKRGSKAKKRGISNEQVAVVVTQDREGNQELAVVKKGRISKADLDLLLADRLSRADTLCTDAHRSYSAYAKSKEINHQKFIANKGQRIKDKIYHVQNVNNTAKRLRGWMRPFNGVATKYLQNYMNWFMVLEKLKNTTQQLQNFTMYALSGTTAYETWKSLPCSVI